MGRLHLVSGELWPVWCFFGSWCRELSQGILWPARFSLSAESACAEVGSCQVFVLPGCLQTSCSAPLELVYLENNFSSSKKILWYMQEESSWRWWLDSCLGKEMYVGAAAGYQSQAILFCSFWDCHSALCSELVPNVFWGFSLHEMRASASATNPVPFQLLCISLPWLWLCLWSYSFNSQLSPLKCLIHATHYPNPYLQPHHPMHWPHWIKSWSLSLLGLDITVQPRVLTPFLKYPAPSPTGQTPIWLPGACSNVSPFGKLCWIAWAVPIHLSKNCFIEV